MVKIRLARFGKKKQPTYRIVATDKRFARDGRHLERLGWYNPRAGADESRIRVNIERVRYWLSVGAQPTDTARALITPFLTGEATNDVATPAKAAPVEEKVEAAPVDEKVEAATDEAAEATSDETAEAPSDEAVGEASQVAQDATDASREASQVAQDATEASEATSDEADEPAEA